VSVSMKGPEPDRESLGSRNRCRGAEISLGLAIVMFCALLPLSESFFAFTAFDDKRVVVAVERPWT
jgi:hypothetical protein